MVPLMHHRGGLSIRQRDSLRTKMRTILFDDDDLDDHPHGHDHTEKASSVFTALASALVNYLLMFGLCCAYGMIMFSDDHNQQHRALSVKMNLATAFIIGLLLAVASGVPVAIGGPDLTPVVFLGVFVDKMATHIAGELGLEYPTDGARRLAPSSAAEFCTGGHLSTHVEACDAYHRQLRATAIFATAVSSAALAALFLAMGRFRFSRHVSYLPTSIMEAFLSCVGYKVFMYALKFCNYRPEQFLIAVCVGVPLYFLKSLHVGNPALILPVGFVIPLLIFSSIMYVKGKDVDYARDIGWMFPEMENIAFYKVWTESVFMSDQINFKAWLQTLPDFAIMLVVCVLDCLLKISGTETKLPVKVDKDYEIQLVGAGNLLTCATGSAVGYMQLKFNVINYGILRNIKDRRAAVIYAVLCGACFFGTIAHINYLPRFFISSLLFFAGSGFVAENLWGSRRYLSLIEWMEVIIILVVFVITGQLLVAVVVGGFICGVSFILKYARVSAIEGVPMRGGELRVVERRGPLVQRYVRHITNSWLLVVRLKGYIFFASAQSLAAHFHQLLDQERQHNLSAYRRLKFIVFDCTMLDGMDASASKTMAKLVAEAASAKVRVLWTHLSPQFVKELGSRGLFQRKQDVLSDLAEAVVHVENLALKYLKRIELKWVALHPAFSQNQVLTRAHFAFEPFTQVFLTCTARIGCPWQYCSRLPLVGHHTLLWRKGEMNGMLYLVHSGSVALFEAMPAEEGGEEWASPVAVYRHGWFLNRETLMRAPSRYCGVALEDGEVICWDQEQWWKMASERPLMMSEILKAVMKQQERDSSDAVDHVGHLDTPFNRESAWDQMEHALARQISSTSFHSNEPVPAARFNYDTYLPEELTVHMRAMNTAHALGSLGLFEPTEGVDVHPPALPSSIRHELEIGFQTYCAGSGKETIAWEKVRDALMFAGIFHTELQGENDREPLTKTQFMEIGHEAVMAPLSSGHIRAIHQIFKQGDAEHQGSLGRHELLVLLRQTLAPTINAEEVDGIVTAWKGRDQTTRLDKTAFTAVMSMFIRRHTIYWKMLQGFREVLGKDDITEADSLTVEQLTTNKHIHIDVNQAEEMMWAADWRMRGHGDGKLLFWTEFLAAVVICCHRPAGGLPPHPRMPGQKPAAPEASVAVAPVTIPGLEHKSPARDTAPAAAAAPAEAAGGAHDVARGDWMDSPRPLQPLDGAAMDSALNSRGTGVFSDDEDSGEAVEGCRAKLHVLLEDPNSSLAANIVSMVTGILILVEVLAVILEPLISGHDSEQSSMEWRIWYTFEAVFTGFFTCDYLLRLFVADALGTQTVVSFLIALSNLCDVCAILPFYIELVLNAAWPDGGDTKDWFLRILRFLRVALMARVARLAKRSPLAAPVATVLVVTWGIYFKHEFLDQL